jgi:hypothetical protein
VTTEEALLGAFFDVKNPRKVGAKTAPLLPKTTREGRTRTERRTSVRLSTRTDSEDPVPNAPDRRRSSGTGERRAHRGSPPRIGPRDRRINRGIVRRARLRTVPVSRKHPQGLRAVEVRKGGREPTRRRGRRRTARRERTLKGTKAHGRTGRPTAGNGRGCYGLVGGERP